MTRMTRTAMLIAAGIASVCAPAMAQIGTAFTYQGSLDAAGSPATGNFDMQFTLWDMGSGGAQQGATIEYDVSGAGTVAVSGGLFTVALDFGGGIFDGNARWLEIAVRNEDPSDTGPYTMLAPRVELLPVPYAIHAASAATADDVDDADADPANELQNLAAVLTQGNNAGGISAVNLGNVGIGTPSPDSALHIKDGDLRVSHGSKSVDIVLADDADGSEWILRHNRGNDLLEFRHSTGGDRVEIGDGFMGVGFTYANAALNLRNTASFQTALNVEDASGEILLRVTDAGALRFGPSGVYRPSGLDRNSVTVVGKVASDGTKQGGAITSSDWFTSIRTATGRYTVSIPAGIFTTEPIVTVTAFDTGASNNRFAVLDAITPSGGAYDIQIKIQNDSGNADDAGFNFIAIGER